MENFGAVHRHKYLVLDSDSEFSGQVDARFHGERESGLDHTFIAGSRARFLVGIDPDPVPCPVGEICLLYTSDAADD